MRLAYVCADRGIPVFGRKGASIHVQEVLRALVRRGASVDLFAHRLGGDAVPGLESVSLHEIPAVHDLDDPLSHERAVRRANDALGAILGRQGPYAAVYERYSLWSYGGMTHARASGLPGVLEVNAPLIEEQALHRVLRHRTCAEEVAARAFSSANTLIAVSEEVAGYLHGYAGLRGRVHVVPNGVDPLRFQEAFRRRPRERGTFTVGFLGSLRPWHGLGVLAEAFAILHRRDSLSRLLVVGDGPERERLVADLERLGVSDAARLTGAIAPDSVPELLSQMDVAVAPYPEQTGFYFSPLKIFEYMAAGLPVVASRVGQVARLIQDERTGLLCPPGDPRALADALERLRGQPQFRRRIGRQARATVLREHTWDARVQVILEHAGLALDPGSTS